jgi:SAM-dependent methyltransferase
VSTDESPEGRGGEVSTSDAYYVKLFTKNPAWSTSHPNVEEARRLAKILPLLSEVAHDHRTRSSSPPRILDLGCGRGWLTYIADGYGECLGIDPVADVVTFARSLFPHLQFEVGTAADLLRNGDVGRYDLVIASEVIEHVLPEDRASFLESVRSLLAADGAVIVSSDRGELYERWAKRGGRDQPVEAWLTERELRTLFTTHGFRAVRHDRANYGMTDLSILHRIAASTRVRQMLTAARQRWLLEGLRFATAECQVWLFRLPHDHGR